MSEMAGSHLQTGGSFKCKEKQAPQAINSGSFHGWARDHLYKSSYGHFHSSQSVEPKSTAIPGYAGYVPSIKAENIHARGFSAMAKQSFARSQLGANPSGLATTGFNLDRRLFVDNSKLGSSSKYGKTVLQRAHPSWAAQEGISTSQDFFRDPRHLLDPTYRATEKHLQTQKPVSSGFVTNHHYLDGHGWKPLPVLRGDMHRSQYRDRFNPDPAFHRDAHCTKPRLLKATETNYKFN